MATLTRNEISLRKLNAIFKPKHTGDVDLAVPGAVEALVVEAANLGYIFSEHALAYLRTASAFNFLATEIIGILRKLKGADVDYKPMYPNFPAQVAEMEDIEWILNALAHYWTYGEWTPSYEKATRDFAFEATEFKVIGLVGNSEYGAMFNALCASHDSVTELDKEILRSMIIDEGYAPLEVNHNELKCFLAGVMYEQDMPFSFVLTTSDILRIATYFSGGDISLAEKTKFKLNRPQRRFITRMIDTFAKPDDMLRYRERWKRLFHAIHVGEQKSKKAQTLAAFVRGGSKPITFGTKLEDALVRKNAAEAVELLRTRPGEFARRLGHVLSFTGKNKTLEAFASIVDQVPTRILTQLAGYTKGRAETRDMRVVIPKGGTARPVVLRQEIPALSAVTRNRLIQIIFGSLAKRFAGLPELGTVYLDPALKTAPLPTGMRSASEGLFNLARGTRIPFGDKQALRFFIYWVGRDIDLSATYHDDNLAQISQVSYTRLRDGDMEAYHSGDITNAPNGAAEFIDVNIDAALKMGARYVVMNVYVYAGPNFSDHKTVYAGWMTREHVQSNEIFDPKTVEQRVSVTTQSRNAIPVVFDLQTREAIWMDIATKSHYHWGGNNVHSNRATTQDMLLASVNAVNTKMSLYDLLGVHAVSRGQLVDTPEDADTVFDLRTAFDITRINSEFIYVKDPKTVDDKKGANAPFVFYMPCSCIPIGRGRCLRSISV